MTDTLQSQWPDEVLEQYEAVRFLGKGRFGSVVLAKSKRDNELVAIKQVGAKTNTQTHYAHREMYILRELNHPNIMKLLDSWELQDNTKLAFMALSYAKGNTLLYVLKHFAAPSFTFSRVVIAQLVDAVAYLHSHAVIHRDIKPDNIVVSNIRLTDPDLAHNSDNDDDVDWKAKREKWHLTLVDFGFARALSPNDVNPSAHRTRGPEMTQSESDLSINKALDDSSHVLRRSRGKKSSNPDFSRHIIRSLSAVGNREYAAPEVKNKVHQQNTVDKSSHLNVTNTLSEFVSDYGMVADAFSVGSTARFILTGVPPHENVEAVVAWHNSPLNKAARWMGKKLKKQNGKDKPKKKYRSSADIPVEALRMIKGMTQPNELLRTSVRDARMYPYVEQVLGDDTVFKKEMSFLKCSQA